MASLNEIKKKIKVIESTSKITNAMKLIATSKLKKSKDILLNAKNYYSLMYEIFGTICSEMETDLLTNSNTDGSTLWIISTSSIGLCGNYNINVIKELSANIKENDKILIFGKKGTSLLKSKEIYNEIYAHFNIDDKNFNENITKLIAKKIMIDYFEGMFKNIKIIYTKFINSLSFEPAILDILKIDKNILPTLKKPSNNSLILIEPNPEYVFGFVLINYVSSIIYASIIESQISENASRRNAMDNATKNASDLINDYRLSYNRIRQSKITQEITEIISGSKED